MSAVDVDRNRAGATSCSGRRMNTSLRLALLGAVFTMACGGPSAAPPVSPSTTLTTESISRDLVAEPLEGGRVWRILHSEPIPANSVVYLTEGGIPVMADTPWTPDATRALLDWIVRRFGQLPAFATISHFHFDASGGIGVLRERGVRVVASTQTESLLRERGPGMLEELASEHGDAFRGWEIGVPDVLFEPGDGYSEEVGGETVRVVFPGAAHTADNVVTFFPATGILFGGCMIKGGADLGYLGDADIESYAGSAARVEALGARVVIAGHGDRFDAQQVAHTRTLAEAARAAAHTAD